MNGGESENKEEEGLEICEAGENILLFDDCHSFSSFFIFRSFHSRGLRVLRKDVFSSLTNLQFLFSLLLTLSSIHFFLHSFPSFLTFTETTLFQLNLGLSMDSTAFVLSIISLSSSITSSSISPFISPSSIHLGFNSLTSLPSDVFHGLSYLKSLHFLSFPLFHFTFFHLSFFHQA